MNWGQLKDTLYYLCLAGSVVISLPVTEEVAGLNNFFKEILTSL